MFHSAFQQRPELEPLTALCRFGKVAKFVRIIPYYQRVEEEKEK